MPTTLIVIAVIVLIVLAVAFIVIRKKNQEANIARAEQLRTQAAAQAQTTLPPTQERAAEAEPTPDPDTPHSTPGSPPGSGTPLLPRRTPGANEMPGKPWEAEGGSGGWFTRKDQSDKA